MVLVVRLYIHHIYIYIVTHIQAHARQHKFHHLTYLREAHFTHHVMMKTLVHTLTLQPVNKDCAALLFLSIVRLLGFH